MSLVPTYVRTPLGGWYRDPTFGQDFWFVCFDDKPPEIELVLADRQLVAMGREPSKANVESLSRELLGRVFSPSFSIRVLGKAGRLFTVRGCEGFWDASSVEVTLSERTCIKLKGLQFIRNGDLLGVEQPSGDGIYYDLSQ